MSTTTFTRYIATADYDKYIVADVLPYGPLTLGWMKGWSKEQRQWIFRHFAVANDDGRLMKLQGLDLRPYLTSIAYQISMVKGVSVITGVSMHDEATDAQLEIDYVTDR